MTRYVPLPGAGEWEIIETLPNPWGIVPATDAGRVQPAYVEAYMARVRETAARRDPPSHRHHYVPQGYLRQWAGPDGAIRVIDTALGVAAARGTSAVCAERNLYRVRGPEGGTHSQVERMLAVFDGEMAKVLHRLTTLTPDDDLTFDEFVSLGVMVALQYLRTPQRRRLAGARVDWLQQQKLQTRDPNLGVKYEYAVKPTTEWHVERMFNAMWELVDSLTLRQLVLYDDRSGRLPTCDAPVLLPWLAEGSRDLRDADRVWWPISPGRVVCFEQRLTGTKVQFRLLRPAQRREVERAIVRGRERFIITVPDDTAMPVKRLHKRPQVAWQCQQEGKVCHIAMTEVYGTGPIDNTCARHKRLLRPDLHV